MSLPIPFFDRRWFNDFVHDTAYERAVAYARSRPPEARGDVTVSVWSHVQHCRHRYENVLWNGRTRRRERGGIVDPGIIAQTGVRTLGAERAGVSTALWPAYGVRSLIVWERAWASKGLPSKPAYSVE